MQNEYQIEFIELPDKDYREINALNHSSLKNLFPPKTPLDFKFFKEQPAKSSEAMDFGTAVHLAVFEPSIIESKIAVAPDCDKRTKAGKDQHAEFLFANDGKIIITQEQADSILWIVDSVERNAFLQSIFREKRLNEMVGKFIWDDVNCKFKADCIVPSQNLIIDLKTTQSGHERAFSHSVHEYCYHTQAEFYMTGCEFITANTWDNFLWIAVESKPPHHIYLYEPEATWLNTARDQLQNAIDLYIECEKNACWPGVEPIKRILQAPKWY